MDHEQSILDQTKAIRLANSPNEILHPRVIFLIPNRKNTNGCILVDVHKTDTGAWVFTPVKDLIPVRVRYGDKHRTFNITRYIGQILIQTATNETVHMNLTHRRVCQIIHDDTHTVIPVISSSTIGPREIFGPKIVKTNLVFVNAPLNSMSALALAPDPALANALALAHSLAPVPGPAGSAPAPVSRKITGGADSLPQFIAKKLLELAILKKEQCAISAMEFVEGSTAVMPCGHLFQQDVLIETFNNQSLRELYECPFCRKKGAPVIV